MNDRDDPFSLADFAPAAPVAKPAPAVLSEVRRVAEAQGFVSRSPKKAAAKSTDRRYRTGRNQQVNIKARTEDIRRLATISDAHSWPLGETLEYALDALEKKLEYLEKRGHKGLL